MTHLAFITVAALLLVYPGLPLSGVLAKEVDAREGAAGLVNREGKTSTEPTNLQPIDKTKSSQWKGAPIQPFDIGVPADISEPDAERDFMEEAVALLNESQTYWVNGQLEEALEILDQAYALLLDANGNPDMARQKDDLRLMISRKILSIYNSNQPAVQGRRSEIPLTVNADVEKEIQRFQTVEREFFISSYQRSMIYRPMILKELKKAGIPEELSWLPLVESGFKINALSSARALGLWQFIPSTGYKYGLNRDEWVDERMDMEKSTRAAIAYLKDLHNMFGDWLTVLAAYNCGEGRIMRTIASQHINYLDRFWDLYQRLPYETARYVPRFLATLQVINNPQKYGIDLGLASPNTPTLSWEIVEVNKRMRIKDIAQHLDVSEDTLQILNAELRHKLTPDRPYVLRVPTGFPEKMVQIVEHIPEAEKLSTALLVGRGIIKHRVRKGETLVTIADKYKTTPAAIRALNKLPPRHSLKVGQRLAVPVQGARMAAVLTGALQKTDSPVKHTVKKGETLTFLARKYETTVAEIKTGNQLKANTLRSGQVLLIAKGGGEAGPNTKKVTEQKRNVTSSERQPGSVLVKAPVKTYIVQKGDSLSGIAAQANLSLKKLLQLNNMAMNEQIRPGQVLVVQ